MNAESQYRILLVEDNPGDIELIQMHISGYSKNVELIIKKDGKEAQEFLDDTVNKNTVDSIDLVLLHLNLPVLSGMEVLQT
ncbi:MAG: hypothetical protein MI748_06230 [Opitutales bacterium]|nr:hypothetical protein [Opitutales bacterium]